MVATDERKLDPYSARLPRFSWDGQRWGASARLRSHAGLLRIERWNARLDGPCSQAALQRKIEALGYETSTRRYTPGSTFAAQIFPEDRIETVVSGLLKVTLDGEAAVLGVGDTLHVPRGTMRRIEVVGSTAVVAIEGRAVL
jgi:mannose-6-phosphate isomerase-like protein (cupin superfamily)